MFNRFGLANKAKKIPMDSYLKLEKATEAEENEASELPYRKLIGCLMNLAVTSRPDIMYSVA